MCALCLRHHCHRLLLPLARVPLWYGPGTSFVKQQLRTPAHAMGDEKPKGGVKTENNDPINLKGAGQKGSVAQFKIKRHKPLSKPMGAYREQQTLSTRLTSFPFDWMPINETDTPAQLDLEAEDTTDVFQW